MNKILIVDDEDNVRELVKNIILNYDYTLAGEADNGEEAVEKYKTLTPDLVILDILMPGIDGVETLKRILQINPKAKVIMLTVLEEEEQVETYLKAGACDYIFKPFLSDKLIKSIEKVLCSQKKTKDV